MRSIFLALAIALGGGCATTIEQQARDAAEGGIDPAPLITALQAQYGSIEATKRIFDVTLIEGRRRFRGEGAVQYRAEPRRLRADIFGPHGAPVLRLTLVGDSLTLVLPREDEVVTGRLGDPRFAELAGERALANPEILGAVLGAYDLTPLLQGARLVAASDGERSTLYVVKGVTAHAFTLESAAGDHRLVEYRQGRQGHLAYRVRFADFQDVAGRLSPRHVVVRDYVVERTLVVDVTQEHEDVPIDPTSSPGR
ncbi:MAG: hypothetical protein ABR527_07605 [Gemmatimonadota bacterium]